jgi:ribonuclease Y
MSALSLIVILLTVGGAFAAGFLLSRVIKGKQLKLTEQEAQSIKDNAMRQAETIKKEAELQAKDTLLKLRNEFEQDTKQRREEIVIAEKRVLQKEENVEKKLDLLEKKEKDLNNRIDTLRQKEADVAQKNDELNKLIQQEKDTLHKISNLSRDEAKNMLLSRIDEELVHEKATRIRQMEEEIRETSDKKAREVLSIAIQRCASDHAAETTISVVQLPSDEMKEIGRAHV